ncbi:MAG: AAA family ATPase, partial [Thermodesulfobacteriota bacterium]
MMAKGIGLCGAHRTGKTTMARQCARDYALALVTTDTSAVFAEHGLDPAAPMDFATRLWIQDKVLVAGEAVWGGQERPFITDRTPL